MKDILKTILDFLLAQPTLTGAPGNCGQRIYAGSKLPKGITPADGNAIIFKLPGGGNIDYTSQVYNPVVQFSCYGAGADQLAEMNSMRLAMALYDVLQDTRGNSVGIRQAEQQAFPTNLEDPETNWPYALVYYVVTIINVP